MNIVINALSAKGGGGQTYLTNILRHLDERSRIKVWIMAPDSLEIPEKENIERIHVRWPTNNPYMRLPWEMFCLPRILRKVNADVLFCPGGLINARIHKGCKKVITFQNMMPFDPVQRSRYTSMRLKYKYWLLEQLFSRNLKRADLIIFISEHARTTIENIFGRSLKRTVVIPHGLSDIFKISRNACAKRPSWLPKGEYLLYVSPFRGVYKNHLELIQGYSILKKMRQTDEKLIFIGGNSSQYEDVVRGEIQAHGLEDDVIIYGNIRHDELPGVYQNAKINIFASSCENCSNIVLEMLGSGRPLISSNVHPMPEFAGDAAVYYDPSSPEEFAVKAHHLLKDPGYMQEMSEKSSVQSERYSWEDAGRRVWDSIEKLWDD